MRKLLMRNLDEIAFKNTRSARAATFFVVGEVAYKYQVIIRKIVDARHEVAFHSYDHKPLMEKNPRQLERELTAFNSFLKSITGEKCVGFRAPSFSLNNKTVWALDVLKQGGHLYDSSVFPARAREGAEDGLEPFCA